MVNNPQRWFVTKIHSCHQDRLPPIHCHQESLPPVMLFQVPLGLAPGTYQDQLQSSLTFLLAVMSTISSVSVEETCRALLAASRET
jgi:hypothetical protein